MSKRSNWCDVSKETRKEVLKRDGCCILCGAKKPLQMAHIFLSRPHGGKGSIENIVALCVDCHNSIDNPIGKQNIDREKKLNYCKSYLLQKTGYKSEKEVLGIIRYQKQKNLYISHKMTFKAYDRCKDCKRLIKKQNNYSKISNYYCRYKKIYITKNTLACDNFLSKND